MSEDGLNELEHRGEAAVHLLADRYFQKSVSAKDKRAILDVTAAMDDLRSAQLIMAIALDEESSIQRHVIGTIEYRLNLHNDPHARKVLSILQNGIRDPDLRQRLADMQVNDAERPSPLDLSR